MHGKTWSCLLLYTLVHSISIALFTGVCAGVCKGVSFIVGGIMFEICDFGKWRNFESGGKQALKEECKNMEASGEAGFHHALWGQQFCRIPAQHILRRPKLTSYTPAVTRVHLVWRLKFIIIFLIELNFVPRSALLSGPKQILLFGRCCNPIYLKGIISLTH